MATVYIAELEGDQPPEYSETRHNTEEGIFSTGV
jgi:hypothetical protein